MEGCFNYIGKNMPLDGVFRCVCSVFLKYSILLIVVQASTGCQHSVSSEIKPSITAPAGFSQVRESTALEQNWWESFHDPFLNEIIEQAFGANFTLKQGYARIMQAQLSAGQAGTELYPTVGSDISVGSSWFNDNTQQERYKADVNFSWELDLWERLSSAEKALYHEADSAADEMQAAAFLLSALIAENYLHLVEQNLHLQLLEKQLTASSTFLELIELRFAIGDASVVDVYQQRQQVASIRTQLPQVKKQAMQLNNRLAVLTGELPGAGTLEIAASLPLLPARPDTSIPADLLLNRPDLRSIHKQLLATDQRIAEAVADRLPGIRLTGSSGFSGSDFSSDNLFLSLLGEIVTPIIDWQKRKREVRKRKYHLDELLAAYSQAFLVAIEETENGIWQEKYQADLLDSLVVQLQIAEATLAETRNRYMQGLTDYLPVLTALQSVQRLEREMLTQNWQLLIIRVRLYRTLGGADIIAMSEKENRP